METNNTTANATKITEVHNLIILDRSGSMASIAEQAIAGVNETIGTIRQAGRTKDMRQYLSVVSFCGCTTSLFCKNEPIENVRTMTAADYQPCCSTPLYDAMGQSLTALREHVGRRQDVAVSVTIITDGYENASRRWTSEAVKALVELLKADGWLFAYIGANQNLDEVKFNVAIDNCMAFAATPEGTKRMFNMERKARSRWMDCCSDSVAKKVCESRYFEDLDDEESSDNIAR